MNLTYYGNEIYYTAVGQLDNGNYTNNIEVEKGINIIKKLNYKSKDLLNNKTLKNIKNTEGSNIEVVKNNVSRLSKGKAGWPANGRQYFYIITNLNINYLII
jgi:hypothetical protein